MVQGGLLTVHPGSIHGGGEAPGGGSPSGRVPGRGLLVLPILEARRRRNRGEIEKKGFRHRGFTSRGIYRRRGQPGGPPGVQAAPWRSPTLGRAGRAYGALVGPLWPP